MKIEVEADKERRGRERTWRGDPFS